MSADLSHIVEALRALAVPLDSVSPDPANVRLHPPRNLEAIKASLRRFGLRKPVVVNARTGVIEAGSGTWLAGRDLGWTHIAAVFVEDDPTTATGYSIADNRTAELAEWDDGALARVLADLKVADELQHVGFEPDELDRIVADLRAGDRAGQFDAAEALTAAPELKQEVRRGEVWALGPHRMMCGDSTDPADVARLLGKERPGFLFTSPPYNVGVVYGTSGEAYRDMDLPWEQYRAFLAAALDAWLPRIPKGRAAGWNIGASPKTRSWRQVALFEDRGWSLLRQMVWKKVGVPIPLWHMTLERPEARRFTPNYVHEMVYLFLSGALEPTQEFVYLFARGELERGGEVKPDPLCEHDVFEIHQSGATRDVPAGEQTTGVQGNLDRRARKAHPAIYPLRLPGMFIAHFAEVGEAVADPFVGSGTTILAAHLLGRRGFGMEIEPEYCSLAIARWEALTGESAVRGDG